LSIVDKLRKYFGVYGSVQDAVVMKDPVSRRSRGFGFITFSDISAVDNALAHEPHTIDARKVSTPRSAQIAPKLHYRVLKCA
jgi:RNA recognition motif-containing protein